MISFENWFLDNYGFKYPAKNGETMHIVTKRIAEATSGYFNYIKGYMSQIIAEAHKYRDLCK